MGVTVTPPVAAANLADNPKNRLYRATQSGTYSVSIPVGVYEVTRQATTNIIIGSTTIVPSTMMSVIFINEPQTSITFNSTVSTTAVPWTTSVFSQPDVNWMQYIGDRFVMTPTNGFQYSLSTDAVSWTQRTFYSANDEGASGKMSFGLNRYVLPLSGGPSGPNRMRSSTDLLSWGGNGGQYRMLTSEFGNGVFMVAGANDAYNGGVVGTSTNGTTWNTYVGLGGPEYFTCSVFANGLFVVGSTLGSIFTSTNGATWTYRDSKFAVNHIRSIAFGNGLFVAVGNTGTISSSTDAVTWSLKNFPPTANLNQVNYNSQENIWAVNDLGNQIWFSSDLNNWQLRLTSQSIRNNSFFYLNGQYYHAS